MNISRRDQINVLNYGFPCIQRNNSFNQPHLFIQVQGADRRIQEVAVTAFHPYKTNLFWTCVYTLYEFFVEVKAIEVRVENQEQPLFVRVDRIALALGLSQGEFLKIYYSCDSKKDLVFCVNLMRQMDFPLEGHKECWQLLTRIKPQYLVELLKYVESTSFKKQVVEALIKTAEAPNVKQFFKNKEGTFSYTITSQAIEFKFTVGNRIDLFEITSKGRKRLLKKTPLHTKTTVTVQPIVGSDQRSALSKVKSAVGNFFGFDDVEVPYSLAKLFVSHKIDSGKKLGALLKVIDCKNIVELAETVYKDEQKKFLLTLLKIDACMKDHAGILNTLFGNNLKYEVQDANHFEFAVNEDTAIIVGNKFAEGSFKEASTAYVLNTMQKVVELKIEGRERNGNIELTLEEKKLLDKIAKKNPYMVPPYECVINDKQKKKLIMFQPFFDGTGSKLGKASAWQLCMAIRDAALGLSLMHTDGYVHSDVKPENLFFTGKLENDSAIETKVADIGMAQKKGGKLRGGTFVYLPPEAISRRAFGYEFNSGVKADPKIDSYSLGVTLFELLGGFETGGATPLATLSEKEVSAKVDHIQSRILADQRYFEYERKIMLKLVKLSRGLLASNKDKRLDCAAVAKKLAFIG